MRMEYLRGVSTLKLDAEKCIGCGMCVNVCPHAVFVVENRKAAITNVDLCMECGACGCKVKKKGNVEQSRLRKNAQEKAAGGREWIQLGRAGLFFGLSAGCTGAMDHHIGVINGADSVEIIGQLHGVKVLPCEIKHLVAGLAEEVVVAGSQSLVPRLTLNGFDTMHQVELFKGGQGAVHRIE